MTISPLSFKVKPTDELPYNLCSLCVALCDAAYNFKEMCEKNDRLIRMPDMEIICFKSQAEEEERQMQQQRALGNPMKNALVRINERAMDRRRKAMLIDLDKTQYEVEEAHNEEEEYAATYEDAAEVAEEEEEEGHEEVARGEQRMMTTEIVFSTEGDEDYVPQPEDEEQDVVVDYEQGYASTDQTAENTNCEYCLGAFETAQDLYDHCASNHPEQALTCKVCSKIVYDANSLRAHFCRRPGKREQKVRFTDFQSSSSSIGFISPSSSLQSYTCDFCQEILNNRRNYASHLMTAHPNQTYRCDQCEKQFQNGETWRTHMCKAAELKLECNFCEATFAHQAQLTRHMKKHLGKTLSTYTYKNKQVPCDKCPATFHSIWYLKQHQLVHTGEMPHKCKYCSRQFRSKCNLLRHLRTVHLDSETKFKEL